MFCVRWNAHLRNLFWDRPRNFSNKGILQLALTPFALAQNDSNSATPGLRGEQNSRIGGISLRPLYSEFVLTLFCQSGVREFPCRNVHSNPTAANGRKSTAFVRG